MRISKYVLAAFALTLLADSVAAEHANVERGYQPETAFQVGDVDHVNLMNGNLLITLPIGGRYKVGGILEYGLNLVYNGKVWDWQYFPVPNHSKARPAFENNAGFAWQLHFGRVLPPDSSPRAGKQYLYVAPDGSEHEFFGRLHDEDAGGSVICDATTVGYCYSRDNSYLRLKRSSNGNIEIQQGDGTRHFFGAFGNRGELWLTRMEDPFGNWMAVSYGDTLWSIADSAGRSHFIDLEPKTYHTENRYSPVKVRLAAFGSATATYQLQYSDPIQVERPLPHDDQHGADPAKVWVQLLQQVTLPDGSFWQMPDYILDRADPALDRATGMIRRLKMPTGGQIGWDYALYEFATDRFPPDDEHVMVHEYLKWSPGVSERRLYTASGGLSGEPWSYDQDLRIVNLHDFRPVQQTTTVKDPYGHTTTHYFSAYDGIADPEPDSPNAEAWHYGLPFTPVELERDGEGRFLSRITRLKTGMKGTRYEYLRYEVDTGGGNTRVLSSKIRDLDEGHDRWRSEDRSDFDGLGHYRHTLIRGNYDCENQARTEYTRFNDTSGTYPRSGWAPPADWLLGDFTYQWEQELDAFRKREYLFDSRGFLQRERILRNWGETRDPQDTLRQIDDDGSGNPKWERYFGGFAHPIGTGEIGQVALDPNLPGLVTFENLFQFGSLAFRRYKGANFFLLDRTIDRNTGLPSSSRDIAGYPTAFTYDAMGRTLTARPTEEAWTDYQFTPSNGLSQARVNIYQRTVGGSAVLREAEIFFDEFGRLRRERRRLSSGWTERRRYHEPNGDLASISEWQSSFASPNYARFNHYDAWGNAHEVIAPDGRKVSHEYLGQWGHQRWWYVVTQGDGITYNDGATGQSNKQEIDETYDIMGRLCRVEEIGGLDAEYTYKPGGQLARAMLRWGPESWEVQERTFGHDARGYLLNETHPESGTVEYQNIDARGRANIKRHVAGGLNLGFAYDDYERLVSVWDRSRSLDIKTWIYGTSGAAKGKMVKATRHNYRKVPGAAAEVWVNAPIVENYTYGGLGGRVSGRQTVFNNVYYFNQGWEWDMLGNLSRQTYPRCTSCGPTAPPRSQQYTYNSGQLASVVGWANLTYHDNATLAQVQHLNQVTDFIDKDPNNMPRPANIRLQLPAGPFELGRHAYDAGGNLFRQRLSNGAQSFEEILPPEAGAPEPNAPAALDNYFLYDTLGRLKRFYDRAGFLQDYDYDRLGNATRIGLAGFAVNKATNRVEGVGYDPRGNAISRYNGNGTQRDTYEWDQLDQLGHRNFPADTNLYTVDGERVWSLHLQGAPLRETLTLRDLGGKPLTIYEKTGEVFTWKADYLYRGSSLLAKATDQPAPLDKVHFTLDHLGTTRIVTNNLGAAVEDYHHYAFGEQFRGTQSSTEKLRFTGHERDKQGPGTVDDLDYMHARYYAPHLGRFLNVDPGQDWDLRLPQSWNLYSYARNSPIKFVDPDGAVVVMANGNILQHNQELVKSIEALPYVGGILGPVADFLIPTTPLEIEMSAIPVPVFGATAGAGLFTSIGSKTTVNAGKAAGYSLAYASSLRDGALDVTVSLLQKVSSGTLRGLLKTFEREAVEAGASKLTLRGVLTKELFTDPKAIAMYRKLGFEINQAADGTIEIVKALPK